MNSQRIYELGSPDNSGEDERPVERLCDLLLRESIHARFAALRLVLVDEQAAVAQAHAADEWQDIFKFPMPIHRADNAHEDRRRVTPRIARRSTMPVRRARGGP